VNSTLPTLEKHHSCLNTRAILEYFEEKFPQAVPNLLAGLGMEIEALAKPQEFLMEINNWVSSEVVIKMFDNARSITGQEDIAFEIGFQSAARKKLGYVQRIILFAYKNPRRSLKRAQAINDKFNKNKRIEIVETRRDRAIIRLHWLQDVPSIIDFCKFNQGIYSGIPTIWNLPPAQVVETRCFFKGDEYCEYHFAWERRSFFREFLLRLLAPWSLIKSTIEELEQDKRLLKHKFNEVHALNLQLREKIDHLLCLQQTSTAAMSHLQLGDMVRASLTLLSQFTRLSRAAIFLVDETDLTLHVQDAVGIAPASVDRVRGWCLPLSPDQFIARVALEGNLAEFPEAATSGLSQADPLLQALGFAAGLVAPLQVRHKIIGVLLAGAQPGGTISEADKEFAAGFANHLAIALENARLYGRLEKSERQYRGLVENAHEGIWIIAEDGTIKFANRRMEEITGETGLAGRNLAEFWDSTNYRLVETILAQNREGQVVQRELEIISRKWGPVAVIMSSVPLTEDGRFLGTFAMFSDISEKKAMEKQIQQHQKMEAVATLACGVAHNFNNMLTNIMGLTGLILADTDKTSPSHADLELIEQEVMKGAALTKQLLSLGRSGKFSPQPIDLNAFLDKAARLFCRTRSNITITQDLAPRLPAVAVDAGQMEQVMLNLFVNAWQAMSHQGEMILATREVTLSEAFCEPYERPAGRYVRISLSDTGPGLDEAMAARIFEPFFTTKSTGQGTGLGLATVYAVIKHHQGIITVESKPGQGATFHIFLPASDQPVVCETSQPLESMKGAGTILLVDDDDSVRSVAGRILAQLGYRTLLASNGVEALEIYRREGKRIDLVILDMIMPDLEGPEISRKLKEIDPAVKVLLSSGDSLNGEAQKLLEAGARGFIQKPYRIVALSRQIAAILGPSNDTDAG
jgi:two-component system cell cycle sensor histidine kinase/response regulator CckA